MSIHLAFCPARSSFPLNDGRFNFNTWHSTLCLVFGPLLVFTPQLAQAKRTGRSEFGTLAERYVREFDGKWLRGGAPADDPFVGSADIQSLADLGNSYEVIRSMLQGRHPPDRGRHTGADRVAGTDHDAAGRTAENAGRGGVLGSWPPTHRVQHGIIESE